MSTDLKTGNKFDILVTEIFDCGLLGEDAVRSILDAKKRLLKKDAEIIPAKACIYCQGTFLNFSKIFDSNGVFKYMPN